MPARHYRPGRAPTRPSDPDPALDIQLEPPAPRATPRTAPPFSWEEANWTAEGHHAASMAMTFAVIGLLFAGIIFGILALHQVRIAEFHGLRPMSAKFLAWFDIIVSLGLMAIGTLLWSIGALLPLGL